MTETTSEHAIRAVARGRVQGVGYRQAVVARATELDVFGWVRNEDDGSVHVHAEGSEAAVGGLVEFLRDGPPGASVASVDVDEVKVEGHEQFAIRGVSAGRFVVEERAGADAPTYALHLEVDGAWRSWSMRRAPSMVPAEKRFGSPVRASDGPGGGAVWDAGTYEQGGRVAWPEAIERGHAVFVLHGDTLQGGFALQQIRPGQWLLIKRRDAFATAAG
ncbi:MAG: acylphosphatase [Solirubrobacteraceae bacterium]|nr:acylphosphatase [Patulibacter sp.]